MAHLTETFDHFCQIESTSPETNFYLFLTYIILFASGCKNILFSIKNFDQNFLIETETRYNVSKWNRDRKQRKIDDLFTQTDCCYFEKQRPELLSLSAVPSAIYKGIHDSIVSQAIFKHGSHPIIIV